MIKSMRVAVLALIFFTTAATVAGRPFTSTIQQRQYLEYWDDCEGSSVDCAPEYEQYRREAAKHLPRRTSKNLEDDEDLEEIENFWQDDSDENEEQPSVRRGFHAPINNGPEFE